MGYKEDIEDSIHDFKRLIIPIIKEKFNLTRVIINETQETDLKKLLDMIGGIDCQGIIKDNKGIISFSSRIQWYPEKKFLRNYYPYNSFTIRKTRESGAITEYEKTLEAIDNDYTHPIYHIEAYLSDRKTGDVLTIGICKTRDLIKYIRDGTEDYDYEIRKVYNNGAATFFVVYFDESYFQKKKDLKIFDKIYWKYPEIEKKTKIINMRIDQQWQP